MSTRPVRINRGKNNNYLYDYEKQTGKTVTTKQDEHEVDDISQSKPLSIVRSDLCRHNIKLFPYPRSHHYYYKLQTLERVGTTSYVLDPLNKIYQKETDSQPSTNSIINTTFIGLPQRRDEAKNYISKSTNYALEYLHQNEDRKAKIDQSLCELRYLNRHPKLIEQNKVKQVLCIKKDSELEVLIDPQVTFEQKMEWLREKIESLETRKTKMMTEFEFEDKVFFKNSLNQRLYDLKAKHEHQIHLDNILNQLKYLIDLTREMNQCQSNKQSVTNILCQFFTIYSTTGNIYGVFSEHLQDFALNYLPKNKIAPSYILDFGDSETFHKLEQVLSLKIVQVHGDTSFQYVLKPFWKRFFSRELILQNLHSPYKKQEYVQKIRSAVHNYEPKLGSHQKQINLPIIKQKNDSMYYLASKHTKHLNQKDFILLYLIYYIYQRLPYFNIDSKLIADEFFTKYSLSLLEKINNQHASNLDMAIRNIIELFNTVSLNYTSQLNVGLVWEYVDNIGLIWIKDEKNRKRQSIEDRSSSKNDKKNNKKIKK